MTIENVITTRMQEFEAGTPEHTVLKDLMTRLPAYLHSSWQRVMPGIQPPSETMLDVVVQGPIQPWDPNNPQQFVIRGVYAEYPNGDTTRPPLYVKPYPAHQNFDPYNPLPEDDDDSVVPVRVAVENADFHVTDFAIALVGLPDPAIATTEL